MQKLKSKVRKKELRGIILGMLLGDGGLAQQDPRWNARFYMGHSVKQENYFIFKMERLSKLLNITYNYKYLDRFNKTTKKTYKVIQGSTQFHRYFKKLKQIVYVNNKKSINLNLLKYLTPEGLAYWYMDDGGKSVRIQKKGGKSRMCFLSTQSFTYEEHLIIQKYFKETWDIDCKIHSHGRGKFRIAFNAINGQKFFDVIKPFILPNFLYKIDFEYSDVPERNEI